MAEVVATTVAVARAIALDPPLILLTNQTAPGFFIRWRKTRLIANGPMASVVVVAARRQDVAV